MLEAGGSGPPDLLPSIRDCNVLTAMFCAQPIRKFATCNGARFLKRVETRVHQKSPKWRNERDAEHREVARRQPQNSVNRLQLAV
jgi:hypothetical protein